MIAMCWCGRVVGGILAAVSFAVAGVAVAEDPALVAALKEAGAEVRVLGARAGLTGYWIEPAGDVEGYPLYVTPDGHGVMGMLYSPQGDLLTGRQLEEDDGSVRAGKEVSEIDVLERAVADALGRGDGGQVFFDVANRAAFTIGDAGQDLVVIADPACPWSRSTVARFSEQALSGALTLHVVPVALLGEVSAERALGVVSSDRPALAWFEGQIAVWSADGSREILENNLVHETLGVSGVPVLVWDDGGGMRTFVGEPDDVPGWMRDALR